MDPRTSEWKRDHWQRCVFKSNPTSVLPGLVHLPSSLTYYEGLNVCAPGNSYIETLTSDVMVPGRETFGRQLGLDEVWRVGSSRWAWCPLKKQNKISISLFTQVQGKAVSHRERNWLAP